MKLCIDCAHYGQSTAFPNDPNYGKCLRTINRSINPVDGSPSETVGYAVTERIHGACGMDAKHFQAKQAEAA